MPGWAHLRLIHKATVVVGWVCPDMYLLTEKGRGHAPHCDTHSGALSDIHTRRPLLAASFEHTHVNTELQQESNMYVTMLEWWGL